MENALVLENVSKKFTMGFKKSDKIIFKLASFTFGTFFKKTFFALNNISFTVAKGEKIGVIGYNGSGKSTLLKVIAGIYQPNNGLVTANGEVMYLTGFGTGLNYQLTFRENIYLIGNLMGFSSKMIDSKIDEIISFSGLNNFADAKLENFSTGMLSRAGFSSKIFFIEELNPEIILLDEVLEGGGDIEFSKKAKQKIFSLLNNDRTVIYVSHSPSSVLSLCSKCIWLHRGKIKMFDKTQKVVDAYFGAKEGEGIIKI